MSNRWQVIHNCIENNQHRICNSQRGSWVGTPENFWNDFYMFAFLLLFYICYVFNCWDFYVEGDKRNDNFLSSLLKKCDWMTLLGSAQSGTISHPPLSWFPSFSWIPAWVPSLHSMLVISVMYTNLAFFTWVLKVLETTCNIIIPSTGSFNIISHFIASELWLQIIILPADPWFKSLGLVHR